MAKMSASDVKMIAISSAVAAAASVIASAIVAAMIAKASERRAQASAEQSVWTILGEQQQPVSGYGRLQYAGAGWSRHRTRGQ